MFLPIVGYEGRYEVNEAGEILSLLGVKPRLLKQSLNNTGYIESVLLDAKGKRTNVKWHRAVAKTFIPNPDYKPFVNHKNGITTDNRAENLEWCTPKENSVHARDILKRHCGQPKGIRPKWFPEVLLRNDVVKIKKLLKSGVTGKAISKMFGVCDQTIYDIKNGRCWVSVKVT